jgi:hypothetical protein
MTDIAFASSCPESNERPSFTQPLTAGLVAELRSRVETVRGKLPGKMCERLRLRSGLSLEALSREAKGARAGRRSDIWRYMFREVAPARERVQLLFMIQAIGIAGSMSLDNLQEKNVYPSREGQVSSTGCEYVHQVESGIMVRRLCEKRLDSSPPRLSVAHSEVLK